MEARGRGPLLTGGVASNGGGARVHRRDRWGIPLLAGNV